MLAPSQAILTAINAAYQQQTGQAQQLLESLDQKEVLAEIENLADREDLLDVAGRAPVIKLVNLIMFEAVKTRASDIHIQPYEDRVVVRLRIDGVLFDAFDVPKGIQEEILSRVKVIGRMNIAEKRLPQDGRATVQMGDRLVDLRIASLPTSYGERIVLRLLDKRPDVQPRRVGHGIGRHGRVRAPDRIGARADTRHRAHGQRQEHDALRGAEQINTKDSNVLTLEDPIEYQLPGISQTQVSEKKGMTFAKGLRSVLRQDPDIIMIGEIRDHETAVMAIQSALTGHLVFSTLHTNDAASAVTRLLDLGIEPYLVASSLEAVLAQRLVRKICPECREPCVPSDEELLRMGLNRTHLAGKPLWHGRGCPACRQSGHSGRLGIFELLVIDADVRLKIQERANATEIREVAIAHGMRLLQEDGIAKILSGATTLDEVVRVATRDIFHGEADGEVDDGAHDEMDGEADDGVNDEADDEVEVHSSDKSGHSGLGIYSHGGLCLPSHRCRAEGHQRHDHGRHAAAGPRTATGPRPGGRGDQGPHGGAAGILRRPRPVACRATGHQYAGTGDALRRGNSALGRPDDRLAAAGPISHGNYAVTRAGLRRRRAGRGDGRAAWRLRSALHPHGRGGREHRHAGIGGRSVGRVPGAFDRAQGPRCHGPDLSDCRFRRWDHRALFLMTYVIPMLLETCSTRARNCLCRPGSSRG